MADHQTPNSEPSRFPEYPVREQFFANKFIETLRRERVAQKHGVEVFALLVVIANTEDQTRYRRPIDFYNEQLQAELGFAKWDRLNRARNKAISAGWLNYQPPPKGHREAGFYWVRYPWAEVESAVEPKLCTARTPSPAAGEGGKHGPPISLPESDRERGSEMWNERGNEQGNYQSYPCNLNPKPTEDIDGANISSLKEEANQIRKVGKRIMRAMGVEVFRKAQDLLLVLQVATAHCRGDISENDLEQMLESYPAKRAAGDRVRSPCAWLLEGLRDKFKRAGENFDDLLAKTMIPKAVLEGPPLEKPD